jgi:histone H3/H4
MVKFPRLVKRLNEKYDIKIRLKRNKVIDSEGVITACNKWHEDFKVTLIEPTHIRTILAGLKAIMQKDMQVVKKYSNTQSRNDEKMLAISNIISCLYEKWEPLFVEDIDSVLEELIAILRFIRDIDKSNAELCFTLKKLQSYGNKIH